MLRGLLRRFCDWRAIHPVGDAPRGKTTMLRRVLERCMTGAAEAAGLDHREAVFFSQLG
jgi:hypothetical protein